MPDYSWVGIYLLDGDHLQLGPFLGKPSPHSRIALNQGICGAAASHKKTIIVDDVDADPRYLACSLETRSEIVVPILNDTRLIGEIDVDSDKKAAFGPADRDILEAAAALLAQKFSGTYEFHSGRHHARFTWQTASGSEVDMSPVLDDRRNAAGLQARVGREFSAGAAALAEHGTTLPEPLLASIRKNKVALKGPITTPIGEGFTSVNVGLRKALALYANLRPVWNLPSVPSRFQNVDLVIVRENTEDLYAGLEHEVVKASSRVSRSSPGGLDEDRALCLRVRAPAQTQARHRRAQSQHHEAQ